MKKLLPLAIAAVILVSAFYGYRIYKLAKGPETGEVVAELQELDSAKAFQRIIDVIQAAADQAVREGDNGAISRQDAVERFHGLMTILSNTLRMPLNDDVVNPVVVTFDLLPNLSKIGGNSPDADYHNFPVSHKYQYRLRGTRGKAPFFSIQAQSMSFDLVKLEPKLRLTGVITDEQLSFDSDGYFEVLIAENKPDDYEGLWLPLDEDSFVVAIREYHHDRLAEGEPEFTVEVLEDTGPPEPLSDEEVAKRLNKVAFMSRFWFNARQWYPELLETENVNRFQVNEQGDEQRSEELALAADVQYILGGWQLATDEALVIEGKAPDSPYWMIQITDRWLETADFRRRQVHFNNHTVTLDEQGNFQIVIAAENLGLPNWLDNGGRTEGFMAFRWAYTSSPPVLRTRVIKTHALISNL